VHWAAERTGADRIIVCPTYYSDDPVLDRVFGARPDGTWSGSASADPAIEIFWTGEEVCSRELSPAHLRARRGAAAAQAVPLGQLPGQRRPAHVAVPAPARLHRPAGGDRDIVAAHGINPALQPTLTRIPALTLADSYRSATDYAYGEAFRGPRRRCWARAGGALLREDLLILQDVGLDRLGEKEAPLRERYGGIDHPAAREIIAWLDGEYRITDEIVQTQ
jgi:hyaluronoglucosaminidase